MTREQAIEHGTSQLEVFGGEHREFIKLALQKLQEETVSRESYEHEYFLRKELEIKVAKLKNQIAEQKDVLNKIRAEIEQNARPNEIGGRGNGKSIRYGLCKALEIINIISNTKQSSSEIPISSTTENDLVTIHTEGLDEEIRCVMCSNRMKSDRGCDGSCVVDNAMYKKVMDAIERRIQPTTRNDKVDCEHTDCNNCVNHKYCDYESNNSEIPTGSIHCQHTDAEIAKSFIEDVTAVKDQLPCSNQMDFPDTFEEFAKDYGFKDKDEVYTNGSELIPVFRVKQWLEHISTTVIDIIQDMHGLARADVISDAVNRIITMPPVTPEQKKGKWEFVGDNCFKCTECGEVYTVDQFNHINNYCDGRFPKGCPNCASEMESEQ